MTHDERVLRLLTEMLDRQPTAGPDRLLASVLDDVQTAPQRGRRSSIPQWRDLMTAPSTRRLAAGGLLVAVVAAFAFLQLTPRSGLLGPGATSTASPTEAPSAVPSPSTATAPSAVPSPSSSTAPPASGEAAIALEDLGNDGHLVTGTTYTSRLFEPRVTFRLATRDGAEDTTGDETDWCSPANMDARLRTSADAVVLSHPKMCSDTLTIFSPDAVECGTPDAHPDAETLAAAVLAHPGLTGARDLGTLQSGGAVPSNLFGVAYRGRVIQIYASGNAEPSAGDPDHCRLLSKPGTGTPAIEIRDGMAARLIFIDVDGRLVVVKVDAGLTIQGHLLTRIYDIRFGPSSSAVPSVSPDSSPAGSVSYLADGTEVIIPDDLRMHLAPAIVEGMALQRIAEDEKTLGRVLLPARALKIVAVRGGTIYPTPHRDGTNPDGSGLGPDAGPAWIVVAEGTFVGVDHQSGKIVTHATFGYFDFDDSENGGWGRTIIPCWVADPAASDHLEGSCP